MKFGWQEGYGAFSVSFSQKDSVVAYINSQKEHHRKKNFREELPQFLNLHAIEYDPRYIL